MFACPTVFCVCVCVLLFDHHTFSTSLYIFCMHLCWCRPFSTEKKVHFNTKCSSFLCILACIALWSLHIWHQKRIIWTRFCIMFGNRTWISAFVSSRRVFSIMHDCKFKYLFIELWGNGTFKLQDEREQTQWDHFVDKITENLIIWSENRWNCYKNHFNPQWLLK